MPVILWKYIYTRRPLLPPPHAVCTCLIVTVVLVCTGAGITPAVSIIER